MIKNELIEPEFLKKCFGTKEWSENSGICCNCKLKEACKKAMNRTTTKKD